MVKSKNKKSVIALVVMAFLLVASIVLAATGAWFTSEATDKSDTFTFGNIDITVTSAEGLKVTKGTVAGDYLTTTDVMPGDKISFDGTVKNNGDEAYLFVKYSVTGLKTGQEVTFNVGGVAGVKLEGQADIYYIELAKKSDGDTGKAISFAAELTGSEYDNTYEDKDISVVIKLQAIQKANFADAKAAFASGVVTFGESSGQ